MSINLNLDFSVQYGCVSALEISRLNANELTFLDFYIAMTVAQPIGLRMHEYRWT